MGDTSAETAVVVCRADALANGKTAKFRIGRGKGAREGFVIRHDGVLHAYRNECRHVPMTMDWVENRFLSRDGCWIASGLCVAGPPAGQHLLRLPVAEEDGNVVVRVPAAEAGSNR